MKKSGLYFITAGIIVCGAIGMLTNVNASDERLQMAKIKTDEEMQAQIKEKKANILKKIAEMKNSSSTTSVAKTSNSGDVTKLDSKPRQLYTLTRMLDYSPHPMTESILKNKPVLYKGNKYHFTVTYKEDWKDVSADTAYLNSICFNINVFENGKKVRDFTTPQVTLQSKNVKKGQVIGIAEVAPFKFNIKVEDVTTTKKGITVLVFKLELIG